MMSGAGPDAPKPGAAAGGIAEIQMHIRRNAEEYRSAVDELLDWEKDIKGGAAKPGKATAPAPLPPVRGAAAGTTTQTIGAPSSSGPKTVAPRDYRSWDKVDVDALLQEMDNDDNAAYHASRSAPAPAPESPTSPPARNPELAQVEKEMGNVYFKKSKYAKAAQHYSAAIDLDPDGAVYYLNRAAAYLKLDKHVAAEADCSAAIERDPKSVKAFYRRAAARRAAGNTAGAIADLRHVLVLEPTNPAAKDELAALAPPKPAPAPVPPRRRRLVVREIDSNPNGTKEPTPVPAAKPAPLSAKELVSVVPASPTTTAAADSADASEPLFREVATTRVKPTPTADVPAASSPAAAKALESSDAGGVSPLLAPPPSLLAPEPPLDLGAPVVREAEPVAAAPVVPAAPATEAPAAPAPAPRSASPAVPAPAPTGSHPIPPPPSAAYEFDQAVKVMSRRGDLSAPGTLPVHVGAVAQAYLRSIVPSRLPSLFRSGLDTEHLVVILDILDAMPATEDPPRPLAIFRYNSMHYLSQCPRFAVTCRMLDARSRGVAVRLLDGLAAFFAGDAAAEAKVAKVRAAYAACL
ncbi:hypothetical protein H9P43_000194 [Blastocladiella emersonii ATCC 22665]|nr:hypothetical protein H9P43_000194 [Blastocladiella emersonii ATCC 22665]